MLLNESLDYLITERDGIYIDGTLGGGGHSAEILKRLSSKGKLLSFDKDEEAISYCKNRFNEETEDENKSRIQFVYDCFSRACSINEVHSKVQGILLDLGVSSRQLDESSRGFSYRAEAPLDMRFSKEGLSAADFLNNSKEEELLRVLRAYGEEPFAKQIVRRLGGARRTSFLRTTFDLKQIVLESVPFNSRIKSLARVFQAIRIAINDELQTLEKALHSFPVLLKPGGRIVVIAYHSLEDRIVKNYFKEHSKKHSSEYDCLTTNPVPKFTILTKKPIIPSEKEIISNARARSAKLRAAEFIGFD
ncbi:MAG: 16S rRNA (cytosine(1402)-N(4))-methyltransferase RsmH [Ignavibacteria bacterium]|nr:16S rRNA (cytosine(1402)-N(4))-methyltransferase RsmH [Ignavibacteria bacterium]